MSVSVCLSVCVSACVCLCVEGGTHSLTLTPFPFAVCVPVLLLQLRAYDHPEYKKLSVWEASEKFPDPTEAAAAGACVRADTRFLAAVLASLH